MGFIIRKIYLYPFNFNLNKNFFKSRSVLSEWYNDDGSAMLGWRCREGSDEFSRFMLFRQTHSQSIKHRENMGSNSFKRLLKNLISHNLVPKEIILII